MIETSIEFAFKRMKEKKWEKIYVLVDIHNTIFRPSYHKNETYQWFNGAKEALQFLSRNKKTCLILWTSSHEDSVKKYLRVFEDNGIHFDYVNENPEVGNNDIGNFDKKLYFNIGIDDKFGFDAENGDWISFMRKVTTLFPIDKNEKWVEDKMTIL